jgi:hypothetical protein
VKIHQGGDVLAAIGSMPPSVPESTLGITPRFMQSIAKLPEPNAETYTAHSTAIPTVQSNKVYLTPCIAAPLFSTGLGVG